ncbi:MerR family transcriptional regulator [Streptomyces spectabilis]|uniref:DNA-binding transcriptional MerR regulator n=1 Tax=Streptomyces spectabilis TaxID=68270 RepID=A0A5P2XNP2_STRST|nr:MerR family transcriptional regulator [Streptomyces spectabilis]MBB5102309.1 DNA-binding transcriptional MerR regulator [Streptomyces spectabilis]MCI3907357.1 MerR family transcriptional regulator [Streptomyces spectabilis]QEV64082.1 MerR family transcriptional regulator [Streptomyces spectabilis]GGV30031.1 HTH-type transcriptional activator TipA [Streptomyces spectabilis]
MSYTVGQVAGFAGVTVRTLHHYDRAGLLTPSERSPGGYRLYSDTDLARLQQVLFYRELGFALDEIAEILADPQANALDRLRARHQALREQIGKLERLVEVAERAMEVQRTGVRLTPRERFEVFGEIGFDLSYATDAELKWQGGAGYRQAMARAAEHSKEDWARIMSEAAAWRAEVLAAFDVERPPDGPVVRALAERHRQYIGRWFTDCPPAMHLRIADDFVADPRAFALLVPPAEQRPGLARYLWQAVHANAAAHDPANAQPHPKPEGESALSSRSSAEGSR